MWQMISDCFLHARQRLSFGMPSVKKALEGAPGHAISRINRQLKAQMRIDIPLFTPRSAVVARNPEKCPKLSF
ncbi:hypothetical protein SAMN04488118_111106 [Epibacterium ulvae]|uniref:Uncharacterized protein n=1 Tax=Epibacterium ulvae TaxID=1156985 RepID=A0A1G5RD14_9RHOB|nr:hypothetical protein SAMN04488118_111106 [Epibacterium ulvae]